MLHNRDRLGHDAVSQLNWQALALAPSHTRRRIVLGKADSPQHRLVVHIRERNMIAGGLGCALWDGSVVFARWLFLHADLVRGRSVLELGAGCGLPGIVAARCGATHVYLTEYINELVENLAYNASLNVRADDETSRDSDDDGNAGGGGGGDDGGANIRHNSRPIVEAGYLDWFRVPASGMAPASVAAPRTDAPPSSSSSSPPPPSVSTAPPPPSICTRVKHGRRFTEQRWQHCADCFPDDDDSGCCEACAVRCHSGHALGPVQTSRFRCDCRVGATAATTDDVMCSMAEAAMQPDQQSNHAIPAVDVILGAEICYNTLSIDSLANVMQYYLKPTGFALVILSDDRDGVSTFVEEMTQRRGFTVTRDPIDRSLLGQYHTREWTYQDTESFTLFTFTRRATSG